MFRPFQNHVTLALIACSFAISPAVAGAADGSQPDSPTAAAGAAPPELSWEQLVSQGERLVASGQTADAEKCFLAATQQAQKFGPSDPRIATSSNNLALIYQKKGKFADAERLFRTALTIDQRVFGREHANVSRDYLNLAMLNYEAGKLTEAEPFFKAALAIDEQLGGPDHPFVAIDLESYAALLRRTDRTAEADKLDERARRIRNKLLVMASSDACDRYIKAGQEFFLNGKYADAEKAFIAANQEAQKVSPPTPGKRLL